MTELSTRDGPVTVRFDRTGRPTVRAGTIGAAVYGLGWACATTRRGQLDLLRRRGQGRLAEVAGPSAVPGDLRQRRLNLEGVARACWASLPGDQRDVVQSYVDGVNAGTGEGADQPRWRPVDTIAVAQLLFQQLVSDGSDNRMVEVLRRTLPAEVVSFLLDADDEFDVDVDGTVPPPRAPVPLPLAELRSLMAGSRERGGALVVSDGKPVGSNAWAVAVGGSAVLANDMHLELTDPSLCYPARLLLPGTDAAGITVAGLPLLLAGTNGRVAWGFTRLPADVCDLREVAPGSTPDSYLTGAGEERFTTRREVVRVRGGDDVELTVRETRWGPVVDRLASRELVLSATLTDPAALDFGLTRMITTADALEAADLVRDCGLPPLNAVLADGSGTVVWTVTGRYPRRAHPGPRGLATGGPTPWLPPAELPRRVLAGAGFVVSCNNGNEASRTAGLGWNFFPGCRARRAAAELAADPAHGTAGSARLQLDLDAAYYTFYRDLALRHLDADGDAEALELRAEVAAWRGTAHRDEYGLALLVVFRDLLREELFAAVTGPCRGLDERFTYCYHGHERPLRRLVGALDDGAVPAPWRRPAEFVRAVLGMARALLTRHTGEPGPVRWGAVNRLALVPGPDGVELSGCAESLLVAQPDFGAATRLVVDLAAPGDALVAIPGAADGSTSREQLAGWAAGTFEPLLPALAPILSGRSS